MMTLQRRGIVEEYKGYQFRRESMAQDSQGKLIYPHNARFEAGPFAGDKAVLVEEGTENLAGTDNSFENGLNGFARTNTNILVASSTDKSYSGDKSIKATTLASGTTGFLKLLSVDDFVGKTITFSMWVNGTVGKSIYVRIYDDVSGTTKGDTVTFNGSWQRLSVTKTIANTATALNVRWESTDLEAGDIVYCDCVQLEAKPYATTFTPSVRANESLTVPIEGLLSPEQGTVEMWVKAPTSISTKGACVWSTGTGANRFDFWVLSTISGIYYVASDWLSLGSSSLLMDGKWHIIAVTFNSVGVSIYLDGVLKNSNSIPIPFDSLGKLLKMGFYGSSNYGNYSNSFYSHLRLSSMARTQEQLAPLDGPPPVDEWTTLYLPFGGPDNVRAAKSIVI